MLTASLAGLGRLARSWASACAVTPVAAIGVALQLTRYGGGCAAQAPRDRPDRLTARGAQRDFLALSERQSVMTQRSTSRVSSWRAQSTSSIWTCGWRTGGYRSGHEQKVPSFATKFGLLGIVHGRKKGATT